MDTLDFLQHIKPGMLVVIPVLVILGMAFKKSTLIYDENIPAVLGVIGIVMALFWVLGTADWETINLFQAIFTAVVQGVLCAGAAVYGHQIAKQISISDKQTTQK